MIYNLTATLITSLILSFNSATAKNITPAEKLLGERQFSLENRYAVKSVNEVMKKNILLNLAYLDGTVTSKSDVNWDKVTSPFHFEKTLKAGETFAYHMNVRKEYTDKVAFNTNSHFNAADGYLTDGYLYGDGVCHLASLINWAAQDAGLQTIVPKDHRSVGKIPQVPDQYGVSIYINMVDGAGANNNLYVTNTKDKDVTFHFNYDGTDLKVSVTEKA